MRKGRSKLPDDERKKIRKIRFSDDDWEYLEELSQKSDLTKSEFVRRAVFDKVIVSKTDQETLEQIRKIGVNINQIVKQANSGYGLNEIDLDQWLQLLWKLFQQKGYEESYDRFDLEEFDEKKKLYWIQNQLDQILSDLVSVEMSKEAKVVDEWLTEIGYRLFELEDGYY